MQGYLTGQQKQALQEMKDSFPESRRWHNDHDLLRCAFRQSKVIALLSNALPSILLIGSHKKTFIQRLTEEDIYGLPFLFSILLLCMKTRYLH